MAQSADPDSWSTSLTGWWQTAKEKSTIALEFMKRDLTEFSQVLQQDAASAVSTTEAYLKDKLKVDSEESVAGRARKGLNTLVTSVSGAFYPMKENDENEVLLIQNSQAIVLDQWQTELHRIKTEHSTFCHEPEGPPELYEAWLETFCLDEHGDEISNIMVNYPETRLIYTKLVPMAISNIEFWQRYFFRVHQLKQSEIRRAELVSRVEDNYEELAWEEDDEPSKQTMKTKTLVKKSADIEIPSLKTEEPIIPKEENLPDTLENQSKHLMQESEKVLELEVKADSSVTNSDEESLPGSSIEKLELDERPIGGSADSSDKEGTTSDEWEKDFESEIKDLILKETEATGTRPKQDEDWENWD